MYCPQCAAQNVDGAKFCRSCGLKLEAVTLALSSESDGSLEKKGKNEPQTIEDWTEKRIKGAKDITTGTILLTISLLIGLAMSLLVPQGVPWMLIWIVFFGWLACWGGIEIAVGLGNLLESKSRLRLMETKSKAQLIDAAPPGLLAAEQQRIAAAPAFKKPAPLSVTENTTRQLDERLKD